MQYSHDKSTNEKIRKVLKQHAFKAQANLTDYTPSEITEDQPIVGYHLLDKMGSGGMGAVFKAQNIDTGDLVALKLLYPGHNSDEKVLQQFINEGMMLIKLDHPNILKGLDFGVSKGIYFLALELIEGESLQSFLEKGFHFTEQYAIQVTLQICEALAHLEKSSIIHRDVKPSNILLLESNVKLCDFALALDQSNMKNTQSDVTCGTVEYISPEQAQGQQLDIRSDIYSLGIACIQMITGKLPFTNGSSREIMRRQIYEPINLNALGKFTTPVRKILFSMTEKKRDYRLPASELVPQLEKLVKQYQN